MIHKFLLPGKYQIAKRPMTVETLVGSCVTRKLIVISVNTVARQPSI